MGTGAAGGLGRWLAAGLLAAAALRAPAERLPVNEYTTADGLAHNHVRCLFPDSRGFLWLCTAQGLSRFDGRRFVTYGREHGLEDVHVKDFLETRRGEYWAATKDNGVYRFDPAPAGATSNGDAPRRLFEQHAVGSSPASNRVNALLEDRQGRLWAGTDDGLYVRDDLASATGFHPVEVRGPTAAANLHVAALAPDAGGSAWAMTSLGVLRVAGEPPVAMPTSQGESPFALLSPAAAGVEHALRLSDGRTFVGGRQGLRELGDGRARLYTRAHGLSDDVVTALAEDPSGNLWIGTETGGAMRLARHGFTTFDETDGLAHRRVASIFETRKGELCVLTAFQHLNRYDGTGFTAFRPRLAGPPSIQSAHSILQDRRGEWWLATPRGLARYAAAPGLADLVARAPTVYTTREGLGSDDVAWPFEDARGDVWVAARREPLLSRFDRATGRFARYTPAEGLPPHNAPVAFGEDAGGTLWVGFREGGLARQRGGRFEFFDERDGVPAVHTRSFHRDRLGRLWVASAGGGLLRIDEPDAERPSFVRYGITDGLFSDHIRCVTGDADGRLYLGTAVGVDRFDPATGAVAHYTTADGLAQNEIQTAFSDSHGALWFGTMSGVSRLVPAPEAQPAATEVLIEGVVVGGEPQPVSALGQRAVGELELGPESASVRIDYLGMAFAPGQTLLFEYRLLGADGRWSLPTPADSAEYGGLGPGRYRFEVRAHRSDAAPATVTFVVQPPIWRRWWFVTFVAGALALLAFELHRRRLRRAIELERVRTRIASDLHDDLGSQLSQIANLSERALGRLDTSEPDTRELVSGIAARSRETVDSMSDIVWALDPRLDSLSDLVQRMRGFASGVFAAREIGFRFDAAPLAENLRVGADVRRHVFLAFKECVQNAARHSRCAAAEASVRREGALLLVTLRDDGVGFDPTGTHDGRGLASLSARLSSLGGRLEIASQPGHGTRVLLVVPLSGTSKVA